MAENESLEIGENKQNNNNQSTGVSETREERNSTLEIYGHYQQMFIMVKKIKKKKRSHYVWHCALF